MKRGSLIVFEGLDGAGKSTQLERLARALTAEGRTVVGTREPHDCPAGRRIRRMARSPEGVSPEQELEWFLEQRHTHVHEVIAPALAAGSVVLCDRYFLSTVAYQGARGLDPDELLVENERQFPVPDLVLLLVLDALAGLRRVHRRGAPREPAFEQPAFLDRVATLFAAIDRDYVCRIDALGSPAQVAARVRAAVSERLGLLPGLPASAP